jgi:hypothetical protein
VNRARFDIGPAPAPVATIPAELSEQEYRAIRYAIARNCRNESPEVAGWRADSDTAEWLARRAIKSPYLSLHDDQQAAA